jgi:[ribosomal protein S5]-alanine N-acetyltransferase
LSFLRPFKKAGAGPVLRGKRIIVRPPMIDDFKTWVDLRKASRSYLQPWEPEWHDDEFTRTSFRYRLHSYDKLSQDDRGQAFFITTDSGTSLLGAVNLSNVRRGVAQMATLGYWIGAAHARQGYMSEALQLVMTHAFNDLRLHRIEASCMPQNVASISLLKKLAFDEEGYAKSYLKINGTWQDHVLFAKCTNRN